MKSKANRVKKTRMVAIANRVKRKASSFKGPKQNNDTVKVLYCTVLPSTTLY
jgi:hypothetical protein